MKTVKYYSVWLLGLLLTACTSLQHSNQPTVPYSIHQQQLDQLTQWEVFGHVAIKQADTGTNANFSWKQHQQTFAIQLTGPFGAGHVDVWGAPDVAALQTANQELHRAASPEQLLQQQLGWHLPVTPMVYWIRGMPAPHYPVKYNLDAKQHLVSLEQAGWTIKYLSYMNKRGIDVPQKIQFTNGPLQIRLAIYDWHFVN